jgi:hypothetical protein
LALSVQSCVRPTNTWLSPDAQMTRVQESALDVETSPARMMLNARLRLLRMRKPLDVESAG